MRYETERLDVRRVTELLNRRRQSHSASQRVERCFLLNRWLIVEELLIEGQPERLGEVVERFRCGTAKGLEHKWLVAYEQRHLVVAGHTCVALHVAVLS